VETELPDEYTMDTEPSPTPRRVLVIGAGLAGTSTAIRLLQFAAEPLEIVLAERLSEQRHGGIAYNPAGNPWCHVFNIQAGRMSVFRENVDDFLKWANLEADRTDWPAEWRDIEFFESSPAPRRIFADYLAQRLAEAVAQAHEGVTLREATGEVVDLRPRTHGVTAFIENFSWLPPTEHPAITELNADHVVIATGPETRHPHYADTALGHPSFIRRPYTADGVSRVEQVRPDSAVVIIGTMLTAFDFAAMLLRRNHAGPIYMVSQSNTTPRSYPDVHRHRVLTVPAPDIDGKADRAVFLPQLVQEWERTCDFVKRNHPDEHPDVVWERVAKAWEVHLPEIMQDMPDDDLRELLDQYGTLIANLRVGAMSYTTDIVDSARREHGQVRLVAGKVTALNPLSDTRLSVTVTDRQVPTSIEADLVISNFGRQFDYGHSRSRLWQNLFSRSLATPHARTRRGVEIGDYGILLGPDGRPSGPISVVGAPREGDEIIRNGRTGAFGFNLAAIKNHSIAVAAGVLRDLESRHGDSPARHRAFGESPPPGEWETLVTLEVQRLTTWSGPTRKKIQVHLDARLDAVFGRQEMRRWTRPLNLSAVARMTDVSVTPRQLRANLSLDDAGVLEHEFDTR
jgi:uncharacterized NAD(P)/FAD-binding protein YdhS